MPKRPAVPTVSSTKLVAQPDRCIHPRPSSTNRKLRAVARGRPAHAAPPAQPRPDGLPPTPDEVARLLADADPNAYERQVDRLLASPHYGERMAVPWLDLVRFTDTVGYHGDQNQNVFPYRDYVIDAFNRNKPFDQFTIEQIAGDLLPNPTTEQLVATGFNRLNMMTREGGAQPKEYLAKYAADRVRTVAITWLGSTMGCAECHDHKFDPFTHARLLLDGRVLRRRQAMGRLSGLRLHAEPGSEGLEQRPSVSARDRGREPVSEEADCDSQATDC